jgi:two-component system response regulator FixJ
VESPRAQAMDAEPTVFLVDDDEQVRDWVRATVESVKLPIQTYKSARDFLDSYGPASPGCLVADMRLPGMSGLDLQEELAKRGVFLPTIMITGYADVGTAVKAMKAGALEFIEKPFSAQVFLDSVQRALERDREFRKRQAERAASEKRLAELTPRQRGILKLLVEGQPNKIIAARLGLSSKTVEAHRASIRRKTQASSLAELVQLVLAAEGKLADEHSVLPKSNGAT